MQCPFCSMIKVSWLNLKIFICIKERLKDFFRKCHSCLIRVNALELRSLYPNSKYVSYLGKKESFVSFPYFRCWAAPKSWILIAVIDDITNSLFNPFSSIPSWFIAGPSLRPRQNCRPWLPCKFGKSYLFMNVNYRNTIGYKWVYVFFCTVCIRWQIQGFGLIKKIKTSKWNT